MSTSSEARRAARTAAHQDRLVNVTGFGTDPEVASARLASVMAKLREFESVATKCMIPQGA
jgi:hypothetical protein